MWEPGLPAMAVVADTPLSQASQLPQGLGQHLKNWVLLESRT